MAARGGITGLCHGGFALLVLSPCGLEGEREGERNLFFVAHFVGDRPSRFGPAAFAVEVLATRSAAMISAARAGRGIARNFGMSCNLKQELLGGRSSTAELGH